MSTEQEDAAMLLELEQKITRRIREQIYAVAYGVEVVPGSVPDTELSAPSMRYVMRQFTLNDPGYITEITKKIGAKMANVNY